jgi:uncharacterized protein YecT (DUF1311 family)
VKLKALLVTLSLFSGISQSQILPSLAVNEDPVCAVFKQSYLEQLHQGKAPSFITEELSSHSVGSVYLPQQIPSTPIKFTAPFTNEEVKWVSWHPIVGVEHSFKYGGKSTDATAVGSIKPSENKSFVFQSNTIGWRGPFHRIWVIEDVKLDSLISGMGDKQKVVPIEGSGAQLIYPDEERVFQSYVTNLFQFKDNFYTVSSDELHRINEEKSELVCKVGLKVSLKSQQITALEEAANASLMTKGVTHISHYYGSMGNQHRKVLDGFYAAIKKPWLIKVNKDGECFKNKHIDNCSKNKNVEAVLEQFASLDPWSYREVQAIREHMNGVKYVISHYYISELKVDEAIADGMANQAIYNFIEKTVSLHPFIQYGNDKSEKTSDSYTLDNVNGSLASNWYNKTELMWAAHFNDYDAIQRLLKKDSSVFDVTASSDNYASVQYLNRSALTYAIENATLPVIQSLLNAGADKNIKDSDGNGLQHYLNKNNLLTDSLESIVAASTVDVKASFDCKLARSKQEKAICSSKGLSIYDAQLGALYKNVRATKKYPEIKSLQRTWLKSLRRECSMESQSELTKCMKRRYRSRIKYLNNLLNVS